MVSIKFEAMEKKLRIILERARDGVEPLEDLEQEILNLHSVSFSLPNDEQIENRAEYMQRPRKEQSEEFIYGYMQGAEWIINKIKSNES